MLSSFVLDSLSLLFQSCCLSFLLQNPLLQRRLTSHGYQQLQKQWLSPSSAFFYFFSQQGETAPCQEKWPFPGELSPDFILKSNFAFWPLHAVHFWFSSSLLSSWRFLHYYRDKAVEAGRTELRWELTLRSLVQFWFLVSCISLGQMHRHLSS